MEGLGGLASKFSRGLQKSSWFLRCVAATCVLFMVDTDCVRVLLAASSCGCAICSICFYVFNHCSDLLVFFMHVLGLVRPARQLELLLSMESLWHSR